jgi:uncharacterized repeat protein (TIGR01451 family)
MPEHVEQDEAAPIEVRVANAGSEAAENVTVTAQLPAFQVLVEASPPARRLPNRLEWALGTLAPGGERTLHLRVRLARAAPTAELRSAVSVTFQTTVGHSCAALVRRPQLALDVTGPATGHLGEAVSFRIAVRNQGTSPARDVCLQSLLPPGLSHPGGSDLENSLGTLEPGESRIRTLSVTLTRAGVVRNHIRLCAQGLEPIEREVGLHVQELKLGLSALGPRLLYQHWSSSFELDVRNEGSEAVRQVNLVAGLPKGMAFVCAGDGGRYDPATHSISWNLAELRPGEGRSLLWNGVAREAGDQAGEAKLMVGERTHRQVAWKTRVVQGDPAPQSAGPDVGEQRPAAAPTTAGPAPDTGPARGPLAFPPTESGWLPPAAPSPGAAGKERG